MNMDLPVNRGCDPNDLSTVGGRRSNGQSIVELTLIVPLVLVTLYIPADFGIAFFTAQMVQNATREATRIGASMNPFVAATVENEATRRLPGGKFVASSVSATLNGSSSSTCMRRVVVTVSGSYSLFWYRLLNLLIPGTVTDTSLPITRSTAMRYDSQALTNTGSCS
jgi:Flp pilus assembly protein TadG